MSYEFTPARRAALEKARIASAIARKGRKRATIGKRYSSNPNARGIGFAGLRRNFIPQVRVNKRSQTFNANAGTIIPGTGKRVVLGGYVRLENTKRKGGVDRVLGSAGRKVAPSGTKRGAVGNYLKHNVTIKNPAIRAKIPGAEVRLGTSRSAGATIIVRRGKHTTPVLKSRRGVAKFNTRMRTKAKATKRSKRGAHLMF